MQRLAPSLVTLRARPPGCPAWMVAPVPSTLARSLRSRLLIALDAKADRRSAGELPSRPFRTASSAA